MNDLLKNPPTWDQLVDMQKKIKNTPPTLPVYAGDDAVRKYYNSGTSDKNRNSQGKTGVPSSSSTSHEKIIMNPPKE